MAHAGVPTGEMTSFARHKSIQVNNEYQLSTRNTIGLRVNAFHDPVSKYYAEIKSEKEKLKPIANSIINNNGKENNNNSNINFVRNIINDEEEDQGEFIGDDVSVDQTAVEDALFGRIDAMDRMINGFQKKTNFCDNSVKSNPTPASTPTMRIVNPYLKKTLSQSSGSSTCTTGNSTAVSQMTENSSFFQYRNRTFPYAPQFVQGPPIRPTRPPAPSPVQPVHLGFHPYMCPPTNTNYYSGGSYSNTSSGGTYNNPYANCYQRNNGGSNRPSSKRPSSYEF
jgi:hypothetical protein